MRNYHSQRFANPFLPARVTTPNDDDHGADAERPSKTALKKQMHALQELGEALLALPASRLDAIAMPDSLREALRMAQRTKSHEGKRRQLQYVGKLMRKAEEAGEVEPLREAVASFQLGHARDALALHQAERWRAELIAGDEALERWLSAHPDSDAQRLRSLIRNARKDAAALPDLPGAAPRHGRAYRELFQLLRDALNAKDDDDEHDDDTDD